MIPHGGGDGLFPENTLYAYEKSQALGGDVIDLDAFMAAGNVLIAMHDGTLDRTTNGTKRITAEYLAFSHAKGIAVLTWVVDDPKHMAELINLGVDGIYTRRPDVLVRILKDLKNVK